METVSGHIHDILYTLFAVGLVSLSVLSLRGGFSYLRHFLQRLGSQAFYESSPRASVLVPVRGIDEGLLENVEAMLAQDYPSFDVTVIANDEDDAALAELSDLIAARKLRVHIAEKQDGQSGKVSKLSSATSALPDETKVIVFADSDARPSPSWLRSLVDALGDDGVGAATGYRWFFASSPSLAMEVMASWNASVASVLGSDPAKNFCWGGSTAIRKDLFESLDIASRWKGALSDDYVIMRALRDAGLGIVFVPGAMTASIENCGFGGVMEFTTRQMKITRVYAPEFWLPALIGSSIYCLVISWSIALLILSTDEFIRILAGVTLAAVWGLSVGKASLRMKAIRLAMPAHADRLRRQNKWQLVLWAVTPFIFLYNCGIAWVSREIVWRGIRYKMHSPQKTEVL